MQRALVKKQHGVVRKEFASGDEVGAELPEIGPLLVEGADCTIPGARDRLLCGILGERRGEKAREPPVDREPFRLERPRVQYRPGARARRRAGLTYPLRDCDVGVQDKAIHEKASVLCVDLPRQSGAARALSLALPDRAVDDDAREIGRPARDRFGRVVELARDVRPDGSLPLGRAHLEIGRRKLSCLNRRRLLRLCDDAGKQRRRHGRADRRGSTGVGHHCIRSGGT